MQINKKIHIPAFFFFAVCILFFSGCATTPRQEQFPSYTINGTDYYSLAALCDAKGISYDYDEFTRIVTLTGNAHRVSLRAGDGLVLIDGRPMKFDQPADIYQGMIVVPYKIKEQVIDRLFKDITPASKAALSLSKIKKIVIDPGHGGKDPGAIGKSGLKEKNINLDIAKRLYNILRSQGIEVVMTRSDDTFVELPERAEIANNSGADLFISIHANANPVKSMNGFEVYYINPNIGDANRSYNSARNDELNFDEECFADASASTQVKAILWDMIYTQARAEAIELSGSICRSAQDNLGVCILGVKKGRFAVLKGARIPAVLVEVGFVSNSQEERMLNNAYYRQKMAEAIAEGIRDYGQNAVIMEAARR